MPIHLLHMQFYFSSLVHPFIAISYFMALA